MHLCGWTVGDRAGWEETMYMCVDKSGLVREPVQSGLISLCRVESLYIRVDKSG